MYLSELNNEQKGKFLEVVYKIANVDKNYSPDEIHLIKKFKSEMGIDVIPAESNVDELLAYFAKEDAKVKKIVYFEILGMVFADAKVEDEENEVIAKMESALAIPEKDAAALKKIAKQLAKAYREVSELI